MVFAAIFSCFPSSRPTAEQVQDEGDKGQYGNADAQDQQQAYSHMSTLLNSNMAALVSPRRLEMPTNDVKVVHPAAHTIPFRE
jgi:hypothetical protein